VNTFFAIDYLLNAVNKISLVDLVFDALKREKFNSIILQDFSL